MKSMQHMEQETSTTHPYASRWSKWPRRQAYNEILQAQIENPTQL